MGNDEDEESPFLLVWNTASYSVDTKDDSEEPAANGKRTGGEGGGEKWHEREEREKEGEQGLHGDARRWQGFDLSQAAV